MTSQNLLPFAICNFFFLAGAVSVPQALAQGKPAVTALAIAPDGKGFLHGSQAGVVHRSFDSSTEQSLATKLEHVQALAFSPTGKQLAIGGGSPAEAGIVEIWSWPDRKLLTKLEGHEDVVYGVVWLEDGKSMATASGDRTVRTWDLATSKCLKTLSGHSGPVLALAVTPDSKLLCSGSADQTIRVWNTENGQLVRSLNNHLGAVHSLAFRPPREGQLPYLASTSEDGTLRIWQPSIGRMVRIVRHGTPVFCVAWSRDGSKLFTGAKDGNLRVVDGDSDEVLQERKVSAAALFSLTARLTDDRIVIGNARGEISNGLK